MSSAGLSPHTSRMSDQIPGNRVSDRRFPHRGADDVQSVLATCEHIIQLKIPNLLRLYLNPYVTQTCVALNELVHAIDHTLNHKGGNVIIPAFTVGRTQDLLFLLVDLYRQGKLKQMDIYVDSPMARAATEITLKHIELLDKETSDALQWMNKNVRRPQIHFVQDIEESMQLNHMKHGIIIISASGMCDAGRIKHHLKYNLDRSECSILITGFQAEGTLGRRLVDGARKVRIYGEDVRVKATIYTIGGLSAHADQAALINWLQHFQKMPEKIFVVHGEYNNSSTLVTAIKQKLNWAACIPEHLSVVAL